MKVAVVGAGIGGLVTAIGLHRAGIDVVVLERAAEPTSMGAGISLWGNGFHGLEAVGLAEQVRALGAPPDPGVPSGLRTPAGRWLTRTPPEASRELRAVHRADLQRVLVAALPAGLVRYGAEITGFDRQPGLLPTLRGPGAAGIGPVDLVVAADGIRSRFRRARPDDPGLRYAGYIAFRGVTARPVPLPWVGETWGSTERFGFVPLGDGRVYWFAVIVAPESAPDNGPDIVSQATPVPDHFAEVTRRFTGWLEPIGDLLSATDPGAVLRHDIHDLTRPLRSFVDGRVVLVGDAAHAMTPNLGQGGNQAIEDAVTLVRLVTGVVAGDEPMTSALARYDTERVVRTARIATRSRRIGQLAHGVRPGLRNALFRLVPGALAARASTALQSWQPPGSGEDRHVPAAED